MQRQINLSGPDISQAEIDAVLGVLKTSHLSLGPKLVEFEQAFCRRLGARHAVACNSGTSALHLVWLAMGLGPGDEVITTPFSFIASSNSVMFVGARPVFVDIDPDTWQIDAARIEAAVTPRTRAILPVDVFGSVPDMDRINQIARRHKLRVLEDSCEALGTSYRGRPAGMLAEAGVFGFYPNKQITTGEGGMIVTDDDQIAALARSLRNQGRDPDAGWLAHARLGYNFRLPEMSCALGLAQMQRLDEIIARRTRVANWYVERLSDERRLHLQRIAPEVSINWFVMVVRLADGYTAADRDRIIEQMHAAGIQCGKYFTPIHLQPFYASDLGYKLGDFPVTESVSARTIALPFHNKLTEPDADYVTATLRKLL